MSRFAKRLAWCGDVFAIAVASLGLMPGLAGALPSVGGCQVFPADNYWNTPIDTLPVHASSSAWVGTIGNAARLHPDWGNNLADNFGIPFVTVTAAQPLVAIVNDPDPNFDFSDESDPGPYPIPANAPIEGGAASTGDRHVLVIETTNCVLYELYRAFPQPNGSWQADSYVKFALASNALRPSGFTSADAAGLPIFPGLVRWEELQAGEIEHAIRFTANLIWGKDSATGQQKFLWPARHASGSNTTSTRPPMGARFRLKASFDISGFDPATQKILRAFKKYGLVLADGGSNWFFQGVSNANWPDVVFSDFARVHGSDFEAVDTALLQVAPDSAQTRQGAAVDPGRLVGISTRAQVLTGDNVMIGGFIIGGSTPKTVVIRARGPSLGVAGALLNPVLTLVPGNGAPSTTNDDWQSAANQATLAASGFAPGDPRESAILTTLNPGAYTAIVGGVGNTTGVSLVEVFEMDHPEVPLAAISTRGFVQTGDNVMIGGFIIQGSSSQTVVIRARGPSLGVAGALQNPTLTLVPADGSPTTTNDDWQMATNAAHLSAIGFQPGDPRESAILITLNPGAYTAIVSGVGGTTGVAIIEVYAQ